LIFDKEKKSYKQEELKKILQSETVVYDKEWIIIWNEEREAILKLLKENEDKDNLLNKPYRKQSIIILAWVFMNFLLAIIIFTVLFTVWVKPIWINDKIDTNLDILMFPTIEQAIDKWILLENPWIYLYPLTWSLAYSSWIRDEDLLLKINWDAVKSIEWVKELIIKNIWNELSFEIKRKEKIVNLNIKISSDWKIWSYLAPNFTYNKDYIYKYNLWESIIIASKETYNETLLTFKALWSLVRKLTFPENKAEREDAVKSISWPVWVVSVVSDAMKSGFTIVLILAALISINLWAFNLLPIPALDWWRFLFMTINAIIRKITWRKWISPQIEWLIHLSFFVILIFLSIIITYNDVVKIALK
jgi:membrane-associated protease RseP (regulator of RpoE activity)